MPNSLPPSSARRAKGWGWVHGNPSEAVEVMVGAVDGLDLGWEQKTIDLVLKLSYLTKIPRAMAGAHSIPASLEAQLALYEQIGTISERSAQPGGCTHHQHP